MKKTQKIIAPERLITMLPLVFRNRLHGSETWRRFLNLASWSLIAFSLDKAAMLVIAFLLARILGATDYGRLTLAQGLVNTAQIFVVLGAGTMLARYIPAMRRESIRRSVEIINLCALVVLCTAAAFTLGGLIGAPVIATTVLDLPLSSPVPYLMVAWVLLATINSLSLTIMLSFEKGRSMGLVSLITAVLSVAVVPLSAREQGLAGVVGALVAVETAKAILLVVLYGRLLAAERVSILTAPRRADAPLLWRFGLPVFLNSAMWAPTIWLAQFIIKTRAPDGLIAVGVFGFANNFLGAVIVISSLTNRAALPIQSSLQAGGEHDKLRRMSWLMSLGQVCAAALIAVPAAFFAPFIMANAGHDFAPYWPVLIIMIGAGVVIAGQTPLSNYMLVIHRPYFVFMTLIPWAAILLGISALWTSKGAYALALGLLTASVLRSWLFYWGWRVTRPQVGVNTA